MFAILLSEKMNPFYQNISSFPTVFFTLVLAIVALYWLVAVLGVIEIDVLDFDIPDAEGTLGVNSSHGFENPDVLAGLMLKMGLYGIPVTIIVSFIALIGWLICYYSVHFMFPLVPGALLEFLIGIPILLGSFYVAVMVTAQIIKPLRPLFKKAQQDTIKTIVGQIAIVRTPKVDENTGEALLADGGAGLILKVRTNGEVEFFRDDRVVLLEYDKEKNIYHVISEEEFKKVNY